MNVDELPLWVILLLAAGAWFVYACIIAGELDPGVPDRVEDSEADDQVQGGASDDDADDDPHPLPERRGIHSGRIRPGTPIMPPGIPSITERLDRWT